MTDLRLNLVGQLGFLYDSRNLECVSLILKMRLVSDA